VRMLVSVLAFAGIVAIFAVLIPRALAASVQPLSVSGRSPAHVRTEWGREDSNLRRQSRRVYSPFPLAARAHPREKPAHCSRAKLRVPPS
jgi:hypothetical protein